MDSTGSIYLSATAERPTTSFQRCALQNHHQPQTQVPNAFQQTNRKETNQPKIRIFTLPSLNICLIFYNVP